MKDYIRLIVAALGGAGLFWSAAWMRTVVTAADITPVVQNLDGRLRALEGRVLPPPTPPGAVVVPTAGPTPTAKKL